MADSYLQYSKHILETIKHSPAASDPLVFLYISFNLATAQTSEELHTLIDELEEKYPFLSDVDVFERQETQEDKETLVQAYASFLLKNSQIEESQQFMQDAQENKLSLNDLRSKYPKFKNFKN